MSGSISTFFGIETTLRGMLAQQRAIDMTRHNIANANTEGYRARSAVLAASDAMQVTDGAKRRAVRLARHGRRTSSPTSASATSSSTCSSAART